jgi:ribonuclease HI
VVSATNPSRFQRDWNNEGRNVQFYWIPGHCVVEVNERADFEAKQAKKAEIGNWIPGHCGAEVSERADLEAKQAIKEGRDSQLLLPVADLKTQCIRKTRVTSQFLSKYQRGHRRKLL